MNPKEPRVTDMPKMVPDREDIARRRRPPEVESPTQASSGIFGALVLSVVVIACAALAWFVSQQHSASAKLQLQLSKATTRIQTLERQLNVSDENFSSTELATEAQLKLQMQEIRKLWDLSNKKNKPAINNNVSSIAGLQDDLTAQQKLVDQLKIKQEQATADTKSALENSSKTLEENQLELTSLGKQAQQLLELTGKLDQKMDLVESADLGDNLMAIELQQGTLIEDQQDIRDSISSLGEQLQAISTAIDAINASRLKTREDITTLSDQVDALTP